MRAMATFFIFANAAVFAYTSAPFFPASQPIKFAPTISPPQITLRESWRESDTSTIYGRSRSPASDARDGEDDYAVLDLEVITRIGAVLKSKPKSSSDSSQDEMVANGFALQSDRLGGDAEEAFVSALDQGRSCGAAWFGLGSLWHEYQHGGLNEPTASLDDEQRQARLREAADAALVAARYESRHPRALALLGDVLNDLGEHREACRAWNAAEARGRAHWADICIPWINAARAAAGDDGNSNPFGPREPLRSLRIGDEPVALKRTRTKREFHVIRLASRPDAFLLRGFSSEEEREAILQAGEAAPMREVPRADDGDADDNRVGCAVAWLSSPVTDPETPWADLMRDAADLVLPPQEALLQDDGSSDGASKTSNGIPNAGAAEDLHVVSYAPGGAYGLHYDATCAVPRAVTVLHYLNDVQPANGEEPGVCGETWLPHAVTSEEGMPSAGSEKPIPGKDGLLVPARAGDAFVFFSFDSVGDVEPASLHAGRPSPQTKLIANQWIRLSLDDAPLPGDASAGGSVVPRGPGFGPRVLG